MRQLQVMTLSAGLAACMPAQAPVQALPEPSPSQQRSQAEAMEEFARRYGRCDVSGLDGFKGASPDEQTMDRMTEMSGAIVVRLIEPGQAVARDGNGGRLNIELDRDGTISRFYCG